MVTEDELWKRLDEAFAMEHGESKTEECRDLVRRAEAAGFTRLLAEARNELLVELYDSFRQAVTGEILPAGRELAVAFGRQLALYDRVPELFREYAARNLQVATPEIAMFFLHFAERSTARVRAFLDSMDARWSSHHVHLFGSTAVRMDLEGLSGDLAAAAAAMDRLHTLDPGGWKYATVLSCWSDHLGRAGRDDEAIAVLRPVLDRRITNPDGDDATELYRPLMLVPYVRSGRLAEARETYRRVLESGADQHAHQFEFLARTGNEDQALRLLQGNTHLVEVDTYIRMNLAAAVALVCRRLSDAGRGAEAFEARADHTSSPYTTTAAEHYHTCVEAATAFARKADACHGNTFQSERVHALIHAEPLVDHLPLDPPP